MPNLEAKRNLLKLDWLPLKQLLLDPDNPRLESITDTKDQDELARAMWREMAVEEVALSIAENGYFEEEPLFVIPAPKENHEPRFYVVEGNRRLTAVKLLVDPALREKIRATDLPTLTPAQSKALESLPVSVYRRRKDLWEYFGFRHVNGPKEWDSLSKGVYIAKVRREYKISLAEIARKIGDQHSTVERIYRGVVLLEQAEKQTDFQRDDRMRNRLYFSHLYTAASYPEILAFLGTTLRTSLQDNPIKKKYRSNLGELMTWLFGSKARKREPIIRTQFPDLGYLREVIGNKEALSSLRTGISLDRSYKISLGDERRFEDSLAAAKNSLQEAKGTVTTGYKGDPELFEQMKSAHSLSESVLAEMTEIAKRSKPTK